MSGALNGPETRGRGVFSGRVFKGVLGNSFAGSDTGVVIGSTTEVVAELIAALTSGLADELSPGLEA